MENEDPPIEELPNLASSAAIEPQEPARRAGHHRRSRKKSVRSRPYGVRATGREARTTAGKEKVPDVAVSLYRKIALTFIGLVVILVLVAWVFSFRRAVITVQGEAQPLSYDVSLTLAETAGENTVAGLVIETAVAETKTISPQTGVDRPVPARGKVVLTNTTGRSQPLVKTTRLLTADNKLFRLANSIVVPANGKVTTDVYADQVGTIGAIPAGVRMTVPGLAALLQDKIYAESAGQFSSGIEKVGVIGASDIKAATVALEDAAQASAIARVQDGVHGDGEIEYKAVLQKFTTTSDKKVGDEAGSFTMKGEGVARVVVYKAGEVRAAAEAAVQERFGGAHLVVRVSEAPFVVTVTNAQSAQRTAELSVHVEGVRELNPKSALFASESLVNMEAADVERRFTVLEGVSGVEVRVRPPWTKRLPANPEKIVVKVDNRKP